MDRKIIGRAAMAAIAVASMLLFGGAVSAAGAFSVDVDHLSYTDTSGPREIDYDFSTGTYGDPLPANAIGLPASAIVQKNSVDTDFAFMVAPEFGTATLSAPTGVATLATAGGGAAILTGQSSVEPPASSASWTLGLVLKNFGGVTDPAKVYEFAIGTSAPVAAGSQPLIGGAWTAAGNLTLFAEIYDQQTDTSSFSSQEVSISAIPAATSVELKIDNNTTEAGKVVFSYRIDGGTEQILGTYTIPAGVSFESLPARYPFLHIEAGEPESPATISFSGNVVTMPGWPATSGMVAVDAAGVTAREVYFPMDPNASLGTAASEATGDFTVSGISSQATFYLELTPPGALSTHLPVLSKFMNWNVDIQALLPFVFFSSDQGTAFGNPAGTGMIVGRVALENSPTTFLAGATLTAHEWVPGAPPTLGAAYPVTYTGGGTATGSDGVFMVKNVPDGRLVQLVAALDNHTFAFNGSIVPARNGYLSEDSFFATAVPGAPHPEAAQIQSRFEAAMGRYNAEDFTEETGFAGYVSAGYLDSGDGKAAFVAELQEERSEEGALTWTVQSILGGGDTAEMTLAWDGWEVDTLYFLKEDGIWMLYGDQKRFDVWAYSGHDVYATNPEPYWVSISVRDPDPASGLTISNVNVTGPDLPAEGIDLYHDDWAGRWHSWSQNEWEPSLSPQWASAPAVPLAYVLTIDYEGPSGTASEAQTFVVESFVDAAPAQESLAPAAGSTATQPLTFSWASAGDGYRYGVELNDANGNRIWSVYDLTGTSVAYDGPALDGGHYAYSIVTEDGFENRSIVSTPFQVPLRFPRAAVTGGTGTDNHPAWSPDGSRIAFTSDRSGEDDIWVVNRDGSGLTQLTAAPAGFSARYPSWRPDGTRIAYILHDPDPNPTEGAFDGYFLYTMDPDGANPTLHPLPPRAAQDPADQFWEFEVKFTTWLDNDRVAFVSYGPEGGDYKLYAYTLSTGAVAQIVPDPAEANPGGDIYKIDWNAATGRLAYDRWPVGIQTVTDAGGDYQMVDVPTSGQMDTPSMPGWRPDGGALALVKNLYDETSNIGFYDLGTQALIVEGTTTDDEWPVFSPDGNAVAFVSDGKIWTMTLGTPTPGDIDGDDDVDLADAVTAMKVMVGIHPSGVRPYYPVSGADIDGDGRVGSQELIFILQHIADNRP